MIKPMTQDMQKLERAAQLFQEIKKEKFQLTKLIEFAEEIVTAQGRFNITIKKVKSPGASRESRQENKGIDDEFFMVNPDYDIHMYDAMRYAMSQHMGVPVDLFGKKEAKEDHAGIEFNGSDSVALRVMAVIVSEREALIKAYECEVRELLKG